MRGREQTLKQNHAASRVIQNQLGERRAAAARPLPPSPIRLDPMRAWSASKDPHFGAIGDLRTDDTKAFRGAADYCYGFDVCPTGTAKVNANCVFGYRCQIRLHIR
jgi:hypothetical protein